MAKIQTAEEGRALAAKRTTYSGGRKRKEDEENIRAALTAALPTEEAVKKFAAAVKRGQAWAITLWLAYLWGKPVERVEHSGEGGEAIIHMVEIVKDHGSDQST